MTTYRLSFDLMNVPADEAEMYMAALASYLEEAGSETSGMSTKGLGSVTNVRLSFTAPDDAQAVARYRDALRGAAHRHLARDGERRSTGRSKARRFLDIDAERLTRA